VAGATGAAAAAFVAGATGAVAADLRGIVVGIHNIVR
jgi:hypothetical protein